MLKVTSGLLPSRYEPPEKWQLRRPWATVWGQSLPARLAALRVHPSNRYLQGKIDYIQVSIHSSRHAVLPTGVCFVHSVLRAENSDREALHQSDHGSGVHHHRAEGQRVYEFLHFLQNMCVSVSVCVWGVTSVSPLQTVQETAVSSSLDQTVGTSSGVKRKPLLFSRVSDLVL